MEYSKNKPTLHILSLPHTQLTQDYVSCAYTQKALKLGIMMKSIGYPVVMYGSEDFDDRLSGAERVTCITKTKQHEFFGDPGEYKKTMYNITWGYNDPCWVHFNKNAIREMKKRIKPHDLILSFSGLCQEMVAEAMTSNMFVEAGIGYTGVFSKFKVFESYAWQSYIHGYKNNDEVEYYEVVIPNYWDESEFPFVSKRKPPIWLPEGDDNYYLYLGRLIERKGYRIAQQACEKLGKRLILAGQMDIGQEFTGYGEHIGTVDVKKRGELMANAIGVFTPTTYLGPFEGVHVEAQLCGVPVITTPFGVYNDTIQDGFNGMKCFTFKDFIAAAEWASSVPTSQRRKIQKRAREKWSMDKVALQYDRYFMRLMDLYRDGWYQL